MKDLERLDPIALSNYLRQERTGAEMMKKLHEELVKDGFKPAGDGALADTYVKEEEP